MKMLRVQRIDADLPAMGLGTWEMGNDRAAREAEAAALRAGLDAGMSLIDTAEMYAAGGAEEVAARALKGRRDSVFVTTKVLPTNATRAGTIKACNASLKRLGIETIDLYLLHWPSVHPLAGTIEAFEELRAQGEIRHWGVSNFDLAAMQQVEALAPGKCSCNQVLYHLQSRGIEHELLPWCVQRGILVQAYSPLAQGRLRIRPALEEVAARHGLTPQQAALAWCVRMAGVQAIPKTGRPDRARQNAAAAQVRLTAEDMQALDAAYPPPKGPVPLETA